MTTTTSLGRCPRCGARCDRERCECPDACLRATPRPSTRHAPDPVDRLMAGAPADLSPESRTAIEEVLRLTYARLIAERCPACRSRNRDHHGRVATPYGAARCSHDWHLDNAAEPCGHWRDDHSMSGNVCDACGATVDDEPGVAPQVAPAEPLAPIERRGTKGMCKWRLWSLGREYECDLPADHDGRDHEFRGVPWPSEPSAPQVAPEPEEVRIPKDPEARAALAQFAGLTAEERLALDQWCDTQATENEVATRRGLERIAREDGDG